MSEPVTAEEMEAAARYQRAFEALPDPRAARYIREHLAARQAHPYEAIDTTYTSPKIEDIHPSEEYL